MERTNKLSPTISIIMPVYNAELYLEEAIESILNQTFEDFEFIIIDDGSTDNSLKIIQQCSTKDNRIICISRENKGIIDSVNEGLDRSSGSYIARMDADDISYPDRLKKQYNFMIEHDFDISGGDYITIDQDGVFQNSHHVAKEDFEILLTMASNVPFAHPSVMIKKSFLVKHNLAYGAFGHKLADDLDLWINMYNAGARFGNLDACILKYRLLPNSFSSINNRAIKREASMQFNLFVNNNYKSFKHALELFCLLEDSKKSTQRAAIKALLRFLVVDFDIKLFYKCFRKVSLYNFIYGLGSFINSKLIIK